MNAKMMRLSALLIATMTAHAALAQVAGAAQNAGSASMAPSEPAPESATGGSAEMPSAEQSVPDQTSSASSEPTKLETVIVTATKRKEKSQDVPLTISVVSAKTLKDAGAKDLKDLEYVDPNVTFNSNEPNGTGDYAIRGVSTRSDSPEVEKEVSIVVDGIPDGDSTGLSDIDHVEVLPGPQGTLFGKNATAGVVSITTVRPKFNRFGADASVKLGQFFDHNLSGNVNIPLGSTLAMRLSAYGIGQDGRGWAVPLRTSVDGTNNYGARAKLLWQATEDLDFYLITAYAKHHDTFNNFDLITAYDQFNGPALAHYGITPTAKNRQSAELFPPFNDHQAASAQLETSYDFRGYTTTALVSYQRAKDFQEHPIDPTGDQGISAYFLPVDNGGGISFYKTAELRLASPKNERVEFVVGLFGLSKKTGLGNGQNNGSELAGCLAILVCGPPGPLVLLSTTNGVDYELAFTKSYAAFEQATIHITDKLGLVLGSRYTVDKISGHFSNDPNARHQFNYTGIPLGYTTPSNPDSSVSGRNFSYRTGLQYRLTPDINLYGSYATGYKAGGFGYVLGNSVPFKPETVRAVDIGVKSTLLDGSLQVNFDLFDSQFTNLQVTGTCATQTNPLCFDIQNAGTLSSKGTSLSVIWRATEQLTLSLSPVYTRAIFGDYLVNGDATQQAKGTPLPYSPTWHVIGGVNYLQTLGSGYECRVGLTDAYRTSVLATTNTPQSQIHGYGILNANIGFGPESGRWYVGAYGRNLLNQFYYNQVNATFGSSGPSIGGSTAGFKSTYSGGFAPDAFLTAGLEFDVKF